MITPSGPKLIEYNVRFGDPECQVLKGYPGHYERGSSIEGLDAPAAVDGVEIFQAGTKVDGARILADGGRVLIVCALGELFGEAQCRAYKAVACIHWPDGFYRRDIGWRAV